MVAQSQTREDRVLILGSGIAGLSAALRFARFSPTPRVTIVCKAERMEGATRYAQGGIASVWSNRDSFEEHIRDTLTAGAGLCRQETVELCVREGPARVRELIDLGVRFTKSAESVDPAEAFDLHREGGHSQRRILHADDLTGLEIERALLAQAEKNPAIEFLDHHMAVNLLTTARGSRSARQKPRCLGAYVLDLRTGKVQTLPARTTVLATGGAGRAYLYSSNPETTTGDGIAIAHLAGARVANMEFMQFHPTCFFNPAARTFLISEALRGEGAILRDLKGRDFMPEYHPLGSLAPRDIVARAIDAEMKRSASRHVWLDATRVEDMRRKFPHIHETCLQHGVDCEREPIPVVPAAHYTCGGVLTDLHARTSIDGLYAVGEVACTGLHGANRLASNSLLEAVVFAERAAIHAASEHATPWRRGEGSATPDWDTGRAAPIEEQIDIAANWLELRTLMWNYVGIVRSTARLERARARLDLLKREVNEYYWNFLPTKDLLELRNLLVVADLIVESATRRKESRGLHYMVDFPERDDAHFGRDTVI